MIRNQNRQFRENPQQGTDSSHFFRTSLRRQIQEKWFSTLIGCIGFVAGVAVIVENEARAAHLSKSLKESISLVASLSPDDDVDIDKIGKIVHITGVMTVHEPLTEVDYGISVLAVKLFRNVQMFQWEESENDIFDRQGNIITTSYNYYTGWNNRLIDSSFFSQSLTHQNPKEFPIKKLMQINENVKIGKYNLGLELKKKFSDFVPITSDERPDRPDIKLHSGLYYHSKDIWHPEIGDVRIQFSYAGHSGQVLTIVAKLDETFTLVPYKAKYDVNILILRQGQYSLEDMFALEHSHNKFQTWVSRGGGWFLLYISCSLLTTILQNIVSHSNFLQELLPVSHSSLKMTVSMSAFLVTTALAWMWYRPIMGIGIILVTIITLVINKWYSTTHSRAQYNRL